MDFLVATDVAARVRICSRRIEFFSSFITFE